MSGEPGCRKIAAPGSTEPEPLTTIRRFCLAKPARTRRRSYAALPASSVTAAESTVRAPHMTASAVARSESRLA